MRSSKPCDIVVLVSTRRPNFTEAEVLKNALNPTLISRTSSVLIGRPLGLLSLLFFLVEDLDVACWVLTGGFLLVDNLTPRVALVLLSLDFLVLFIRVTAELFFHKVVNASEGYFGLDDELPLLDKVALACFISIGLSVLLRLFFFPGCLVLGLQALDFEVGSLLANTVEVLARVARINVRIFVNTAEDVTILAGYSLELLMLGSTLALTSATEALSFVLEASICATLAPTHVGNWMIMPPLALIMPRLALFRESRLAGAIVGPISPLMGLVGATVILLPASRTTHGLASSTSTSTATFLRSWWTLSIVGVPVLLFIGERPS